MQQVPAFKRLVFSSAHQCLWFKAIRWKSCGPLVTAYGPEGLSCRLGQGRIAGYACTHKFHFGLIQAGFSATKEPPGFARFNGKRPDGATLIPWESGKMSSQGRLCHRDLASVISSQICRGFGWRYRNEEHFSKTHSVHFLKFLSYHYHGITYMYIYSIQLQTVSKLAQKHEKNEK